MKTVIRRINQGFPGINDPSYYGTYPEKEGSRDGSVLGE